MTNMSSDRARLGDATVAVLGVTYRAGVLETWESPALDRVLAGDVTDRGDGTAADAGVTRRSEDAPKRR